MYGAIIGDMAGSIFEFAPTKSKDFELLPEYSEVTDDSVMTTAVADTLLGLSGDESDDEIKKLFVKKMKEWGRRYPDAGYGGRFSSWLTFFDTEPYGSFGNGSAMRVSPCGWLFDNMEMTRKMAMLSSAVTHDHAEGIKGAESVASAIFMARNGASKEEIKEYITREFEYDLNRTCDDIRPEYEFDVTCQGSVPEAIIAFLEGTDYEDTIRNAISLGGDADTQAAIAGSIAEAYFGAGERCRSGKCDGAEDPNVAVDAGSTSCRGIPQWLIDKADKHIPDDIKEVIKRFYSRIG